MQRTSCLHKRSRMDESTRADCLSKRLLTETLEEDAFAVFLLRLPQRKKKEKKKKK